MIFSQNRKQKITLTSTEDGIHLDGSVLWLDSKNTADISFLSSPQEAAKRLSSRVIASEESMKILECFRQKPKALVCQYMRPFAIGPIHMELLPSGAGLGAASLLIDVEDKKFLYISKLQPQNIDICHQMQLREADTLILSAKTPFQMDKTLSRKAEKERLVEKVRQINTQGQSPILYCDPFATASELTKYLTACGLTVDVHPLIHKINKVYESHGAKLGPYKIYDEAKSDSQVSIFPLPQQRRLLRRGLPKRPILALSDQQSLELNDGLFRKIEGRFYIPSSYESKDLKGIIKKVSPSEIVIFGPYAKDYAKHLRSVAPSVKALFPKHLPSLF